MFHESRSRNRDLRQFVFEGIVGASPLFTVEMMILASAANTSSELMLCCFSLFIKV